MKCFAERQREFEKVRAIKKRREIMIENACENFYHLVLAFAVVFLVIIVAIKVFEIAVLNGGLYEIFEICKSYVDCWQHLSELPK